MIKLLMVVQGKFGRFSIAYCGLETLLEGHYACVIQHIFHCVGGFTISDAAITLAVVGVDYGLSLVRLAICAVGPGFVELLLLGGQYRRSSPPLALPAALLWRGITIFGLFNHDKDLKRKGSIKKRLLTYIKSIYS